jgi:hypothetical protein
MKKLVLGAAILVAPMLAAMPQAMAQDGSRMMTAMFPDPNGDGVTTKDEILAAGAARFAGLDADKDGKLNEAERSGAPGGRMMARADVNGDGAVTREELAAAAAARFERVDANKDGKVDAAERDAARDRMMQMRGNN